MRPEHTALDRRRVLQASLALGGSAWAGAGIGQEAAALVPIRVDPADVFRTTVCLRPFRAEGPRIEAETVGRKRVVHNYGHGGSGWSLSWGSAARAVALAMDGGPRKIAVIGAGALGLTAAITAQRAGAEVTIYAKERFPFVRSARATGTWSPDSRVAKTASVSADFASTWEIMARTSLTLHQSYVGLPGNPVEWMDNYILRHPKSVLPNASPPPSVDEEAGFIWLEGRLQDVVPRYRPFGGHHPFSAKEVRRGSQMTFNVASYSHQLEADFLAAGGRFVHARFHDPSDVLRLKEPVIINCTGYGARALWKDDSVVPVRGQIVWLVPQPDVHYGFYYNSVSVLARRDGIVVQYVGPDENFGWNDDNETVDVPAIGAALDRLKGVYTAASLAQETQAGA